jgi:hypothetical protein
MKRQMFLATAFSAALAVGVAAQTPPQNPPTGSTPSQERSQGQVTVTGCLAQAPSSSTGTTGTTGTAGSTEYILKNATMGSGSASSTAGTTGAATSASAMGKSFKLVGGSSSDLKDNVNAKVEVRGSIEKPSAMATPPAGATASDRDVQTLRVTSVKKIADSCQ